MGDRKLKKLIACAVVFAISIGMTCFATPVMCDAEGERYVNTSPALFDDFNGDSLDSSKWLIAHKQWGGNNGGVVKENVSVSDGTLKLEGHGLEYTGNVAGVGRADGKLTGAAIATRDYYASGSYEVKAKVAPDLGACTAFWTFEYEEAYQGEEGYDPKYAVSGGEYCTVNHEIDIEIPTATSKNKVPNFSSARFNTFVRENDYTSKKFDLGYAQNDGEYHIYRFDWHTGSATETARVDFYIDNVLLHTIYTDIPTKEGRFWVGLWFPCSEDADKDGICESGWAGKADFDITVLEVDYVKITPYREEGDVRQNEDYAYDGWAENSFPELAEKENYEHVLNGDFSKNDSNWKISGNAKIEDAKAVLSSGQSTSEISQVVNVLPGATYTMTANVVTDGARVTVGASKENGSKDQSYSTNKSGKVKITFNNETVNTTIKVYVKVERYQGSNVVVTADDISLIGASFVSETKIEFEPLDPDDDTDPNPNLINDGSFSQGDKFWSKSGSARIENNFAYLASGNDTDSISQTVYVEKGETYTLSADVTSSGAEIEFGVKGYEGRYTKFSEKYTANGKYYMTFTVASNIDNVEVFATVERYQSNGLDCSIGNIAMVKGTAPLNVNNYGVKGYSLDIKDGIFYLNVYADFTTDMGNYTVECTMPDGSVLKTKVKDASTVTKSGNTYKIFSLNIAAKDIYKKIAVSVTDDKGQRVGADTKVSVYDYACTLKATNAAYADFIDSLLVYGYYANAYFGGENITAYNVLRKYSTSDYTSISQSITSKSGIKISGYIGTSLVLENKIILRHYFNVPVSGAVKSGSVYYVQQSFNPKQFDQIISGYNYSVNDYIKSILVSDADSKIKDLVCALYEYEIEAKKLK